jgi:phenylacetate-coenzyme A ligase PaaK-like adenylate-forming protein
VEIGDDELYPAGFDELLFSVLDIIDYQVILSSEGNKNILAFKIEVGRNNETIRKEINKKLLGHPVIRKNLDAGIMELSPLELVSQGNLTRMNRAKKLILDKRQTIV